MNFDTEPNVQHAPAKINLALHVTGRRSDGFHLLESLVVFANYGDRLKVTPAEHDAFTLSGPFASQAPADASNLVIRARDALRAAFPDSTDASVAIALEKNLPAASGIGGGSSDAAAALRALAGLWNIEADLSALSLTLGADLPMCLAARPLLARGIGESIEPVANFPTLHLVLANPGVSVSTPEIFRALACRDNPPLPPMPHSLDPQSLLQWLGATRNDLEIPARTLAPSIGDALDALAANDALFARMSGSGATCFGLYTTLETARRAAASIARSRPNWFVAATSSMS